MVQPVGPSHGLTASVIVSCVAYGVPAPTVAWRYGGSLLPEGLSHTRQESFHGVAVVRSSLELCPLLEGTRSGLYSCEVQNDVAIKSAPFRLCFIGQSMTTLHILTFLCAVGPFGLLVTPADRNIIAGGFYYLPCVAFSKKASTLTITWSAGGELISRESPRLAIFESNTTQNGVYLFRSVLELSCASFEDAMEYACSATDGTESREVSFTLLFTCEHGCKHGH